MCALHLISYCHSPLEGFGQFECFFQHPVYKQTHFGKALAVSFCPMIVTSAHVGEIISIELWIYWEKCEVVVIHGDISSDIAIEQNYVETLRDVEYLCTNTYIHLFFF